MKEGRKDLEKFYFLPFKKFNVVSPIGGYQQSKIFVLVLLWPLTVISLKCLTFNFVLLWGFLVGSGL